MENNTNITMSDRRAAQFWLLVALLNGCRFAIAELEPHKMQHLQKMRFNALKTNIDNFLNNMQASANKEDKQLLESMSFENVGAMAELTCMIAQLPPQVVDWYIEQCKRLTFAAVNEANKNA
jgi:hypothetical protein